MQRIFPAADERLGLVLNPLQLSLKRQLQSPHIVLAELELMPQFFDLAAMSRLNVGSLSPPSGDSE